ncbi:IS1249 family transposase [Nocardioides humilatus]|uniref:Mutator family transposase n=1 Tax=Nocardioides humilatus TaxID=2607660 RepID=A0A5B1L318_9ACTN|nr:IS1249 family transposase [Nocardioides humilatus]KAA1415003.1 IS1249 family transposase [Nocardioides humilatus]
MGITGEDVGHSGGCVLCGARLKKNGTTSAGRTRWRCTSCGSSTTRARPDVTRRAQLERFIAWLLGSGTQGDADSSARTFRRVHAWCWNVAPEVTITGELYDEIQIDGIYLDTGWCCLIAITGGKVIDWQWCDREKTIAWKQLLKRIPAPTVVVCDGGGGLAVAIEECWPDTSVQRCLVHVQRNVRTYLTSRPRTTAGKALWGLARTLTKITTLDEATAWMVLLHDWHDLYGHLVRERTYRYQLTRPGDGAAFPDWIRPGQKWWYTHERLRKAYRLLAKLVERGHLFAYLDPSVRGLHIASTTNQIEGGINAQLRDMLRRHRGMTTAHQRRAVEWWLHAHAIAAPEPASLIRARHYRPRPRKTTTPEEPIGPAGYDTGLTAEEGLWLRRGWGGRS